ncbi:Rho1 guanine nucleotide exchange factor 1 [Elsinoe australis]|uniref:Rho1 guanine nucleotide exchange factor 1 n=1 Tax=Elsinoe australis TaxID=40998 RepID=A0A4V6DV75_9PEZI|nr:Rho1 guanine nucleotide exchange factor 1 [Elsinoe australis]
MAQYQGRDYGGRPPHGAPPSGHQRDAAFSNIFGAHPPPGRSQTMTNLPGAAPPQQRAATMSSQPPPRPQADFAPRPPPIRQPVNGYPQQMPQRPMVNGDHGQDGGHPPPHRQSYQQQGPPAQQPPPSQSQQPQYLPQPLRPDRRPYGAPQRLDPRGAPPTSQYTRAYAPRPYVPAGPGPGPGSGAAPGPGPGPALNSDSYRSQSMASTSRPSFQPTNPNYSISPAHTFRQQPYMGRTTAQGRVVPDRPQDERTMSMSSYTREEYSQTMSSGRVIPARKRGDSGEPDWPTDRVPNGRPNGSIDGQKQRAPSQGSVQSRTMSMASTMTTSPSLNYDEGASPRPSQGPSQTPTMTTRSNSQLTGSTMVAQKRPSLVYGALLSRVAQAFRERIAISEREKDGLVYKNAFTGYEAVELIAYVIRTSDRNLALLLGRSLDAQKFFHEVAYAHRLRDSPNEIYQFKEAVVEETPEVNGVFTLLTECYSPTCTRDHLCYSIACPRRLEQQSRLNLKIQPGLKRESSQASLHEEEVDDEQRLWINTVSPEVADSVDDREKKRQEVIAELMYTERDFVKDLEYLRDFWIKPLRNPAISPIPEHRREKFIRTVFSNCQEVHSVNVRLASALTRRQQLNPVVRNVGDIFLEYVPQFSPFIRYGANQLFGKFEFEKEKASNQQFARFVEETERLKESRKLELNGYLTKPTTRLARYPLLLSGVLKASAEDNPDTHDIPKAIEMVKNFLGKVNEESGKAENIQQLMQLNQSLKWGNIPYVDLKLTEESRQLIFKSNFKKSPTAEVADIQAYLFDHAVLLVRQKIVNKREEQKVYRKPIPLELLVVAQMEELARYSLSKRPSSSMIPGARAMTNNTPKDQGYPLTFRRLGKGGYELQLFCTSQILQEKWMKHIHTQQEKLRERSNVFTKTNLSENFFSAAIRVNCCVPIDGARKLVLGTDFGIYVADRKPKDGSKPKRLLDAKLVTQIDVLEQYQILLVLADKVMYTYPLESLDPEESQAAPSKRGRKICHANYFNAGMCNGKLLVCCVKSSSLSSTVKVFEPMDSVAKNKKKSGFSRMLAGGQDVLRPYKEFYIPMESNSIHFLRSKLCVGGAKGFEIVSLDTLETQSLLDQADTSLDFVVRRENVKPIYIERTPSEFLLCYTDFSFFVNKNGWRARNDWKIVWEGAPTAFATWGDKYILAFEQDFIEVRLTETGGLVCVLTARNIRFLHSSSREILYAYEDEAGEDVIASLDFWGNNH